MLALWLAPSTAFVLAILGVLAIYCEFVWPGKVYPGVLGSIVLIIGAYFLWLNAPTGIGLLLVGLAILLFLVETLWNTRFAAGIAGTTLLSFGVYRLFAGASRIGLGLAIPVCIVFGTISVFLAYGARRARQNKWSDVTRAE
jgi:membrane-bound serine protease (ClpP class)